MKITEKQVTDAIMQVNDLLGKNYALMRFYGKTRTYTINEVTNEGKSVNSAFNMNTSCVYSLREVHTAVWAVLFALYKLKSGVLTLKK